MLINVSNLVRQEKQFNIADSNESTARLLLDSRFKLSDKGSNTQQIGTYLHLKNLRSDALPPNPSFSSYSLENTPHVMMHDALDNSPVTKANAEFYNEAFRSSQNKY
jgi:hypothetical protein